MAPLLLPSNSRGVYIVLLLTVVCSVGSNGNVYNKDVTSIAQNFKEKMRSATVNQINRHITNAYLYTAYASYFNRADVNLPGFEKFFKDRSAAVQAQADFLTKVVIDRGGRVSFNNVLLKQRCQQLSKDLEFLTARFPHTCYFVINSPTEKNRQTFNFNLQQMPTALDALEDSLALERASNQDLIDLQGDAAKYTDPGMRVKIDVELERQVDIIERVTGLITRLLPYRDDGEYALAEYVLDGDLMKE